MAQDRQGGSIRIEKPEAKEVKVHTRLSANDNRTEFPLEACYRLVRPSPPVRSRDVGGGGGLAPSFVLRPILYMKRVLG